MNRVIHVILIILVFSAALPAYSHDQDILQVTFWNIEGGINISKGYCGYFTSGWKYFFPHETPAINDIGTLLKKNGTDIMLLAEVENPSWRNKYKDEIDILCSVSSLPYSVFYPTSRFMGLGNQGNAIISRYAIYSWKEYLLPGGIEDRKLCEAIILSGNRSFTVYATHLSQGCARKKQIKKIAGIISKKEGPVILAGDFNTGDNEELRPLIESGLRLLDSSHTCPSWKASKTLDHIFISPHLEPVSVTVPDVRYSDHLPVIAVLRFMDDK